MCLRVVVFVIFLGDLVGRVYCFYFYFFTSVHCDSYRVFFSFIVPEMFTSTNIPLHLSSLPSRAMGIFHILIKPYPLRLFRHGLFLFFRSCSPYFLM